MKTVALIDIHESDRQKAKIDSYWSSLSVRADWPRPILSETDPVASPSRTATVGLKRGDLLILPEASILGGTFSAVLPEIEQLLRRGISLGIAEPGTFIDAQGTKGKGYADIIFFITDLLKRMNSRKTKTALGKAKLSGKKIGRPSRQNRLDGREGEISAYLSKRVSKSAIARILGISRTTLAQFISARHLDRMEERDLHKLNGGTNES